MATSFKISTCQHNNSVSLKRDKQQKLKLNPQNKMNTCMICGSLISSDKAIKTQRFQTNFHTSLNRYLKNMQRRTFQPLAQSIEISKEAFNLLENICQKFQFGIETLALGIYLYQLVQSKRPKPQDKDDLQERFVSSTCLIVAAKAVQLDRKVPYLNRYQRYAQTLKTKQQYEKQEQKICDMLNFKLQYSTFITFINFILSIGVVYESDKIQEQEVFLIQDDILQKAKESLKNGWWTTENQQKVALQIIKTVRKKYSLKDLPQNLNKIFFYSTLKSAIISPTSNQKQNKRTDQQKTTDEKIKSLKITPKTNKDSLNVLQPLKTDRNANFNSNQRQIPHPFSNNKSMEMKYISLRNNQIKKQNRVLSNIKENNVYLSSGLNLGPKKISVTNENSNNMLCSLKVNEKGLLGTSNYLKNKSLAINSQNNNGLSAYNPNTSIKYPSHTYKSEVNVLRHSNSSNAVNYDRIIGYRLGSKLK